MSWLRIETHPTAEQIAEGYTQQQPNMNSSNSNVVAPTAEAHTTHFDQQRDQNMETAQNPEINSMSRSSRESDTSSLHENDTPASGAQETSASSTNCGEFRNAGAVNSQGNLLRVGGTLRFGRMTATRKRPLPTDEMPLHKKAKMEDEVSSQQLADTNPGPSTSRSIHGCGTPPCENSVGRLPSHGSNQNFQHSTGGMSASGPPMCTVRPQVNTIGHHVPRQADHLWGNHMPPRYILNQPCLDRLFPTSPAFNRNLQYYVGVSAPFAEDPAAYTNIQPQMDPHLYRNGPYYMGIPPFAEGPPAYQSIEHQTGPNQQFEEMNYDAVQQEPRPSTSTAHHPISAAMHRPPRVSEEVVMLPGYCPHKASFTNAKLTLMHMLLSFMLRAPGRAANVNGAPRTFSSIFQEFEDFLDGSCNGTAQFLLSLLGITPEVICEVLSSDGPAMECNHNEQEDNVPECSEQVRSEAEGVSDSDTDTDHSLVIDLDYSSD